MFSPSKKSAVQKMPTWSTVQDDWFETQNAKCDVLWLQGPLQTGGILAPDQVASGEFRQPSHIDSEEHLN